MLFVFYKGAVAKIYITLRASLYLHLAAFWLISYGEIVRDNMLFAV